jgi:hypothetical protein
VSTQKISVDLNSELKCNSSISDLKGIFVTPNKSISIDQMKRAVIQKVMANNECLHSLKKAKAI